MAESLTAYKSQEEFRISNSYILFISSVVRVRVVEPFSRRHGASAEHPPAGVCRGTGTVLGCAVLFLVILSLSRGRPERRTGRAVRAAKIVAVFVRTDPQAPVVLGELGRGTGQ